MITMTGTILHLDGKPDSLGDIFDENTAVSLPSSEVPVTFDFQDSPEFWLGNAKLYFEQNAIRYKMNLDETKLPKYALETLTPAMNGYGIRNGFSVESVTITSIGLSESRNADFRIKQLKDQK